MSIKLSLWLLALKDIEQIESLLKILKKEKIKYIEIPITKFLPGYNIDITKINNLKKLLKKYEKDIFLNPIIWIRELQLKLFVWKLSFNSNISENNSEFDSKRG